MLGSIIAIILRLAIKLPKLVRIADQAATKIGATPALGKKLLDALVALEEVLAALLPEA